MEKDKLTAEVKAVESMVKIALNVKPKNHKKSGKTRAEEIVLLVNLVGSIQSRLIAYDCLQAAVKLSKDNKAISAKAVELVEAKRRELAGAESPKD